MAIRNLISDNQYAVLTEGLGFWINRTLKEDITHKSYCQNQYTVLDRISDRRKTFLDDQFLKDSGVFFPEQDDWKYFVSMFGGLSDVALVKSLYPTKELVINETNSDCFDILRSLRDYPELFLEVYTKALSLIPKATDSVQKISDFYRVIKKNFAEHYGSRTAAENSALLLFLLHYSDNTSGIQSRPVSEVNVPYRGRKYWSEQLDTIHQWIGILKEAHLWNTQYDQFPIPKAKSFIYAKCPMYFTNKLIHEDMTRWNSHQYNSFRSFIEDVNRSSNHYICASSILNRSLTMLVKESQDWKFTSVDPSINRITNSNKPEMLLTNFSLSGLTRPEALNDIRTYSTNTSYVMEYSQSYKRYMSALI